MTKHMFLWHVPKVATVFVIIKYIQFCRILLLYIEIIILSRVELCLNCARVAIP